MCRFFKRVSNPIQVGNPFSFSYFSIKANFAIMKKCILFFMTITLTGLISMNAQSVSPDIYFDDEPGTHNMGITSDGEFFYTCNGGKTYEGKISKFSKNGNFMKSYEIDLDMRSIMYNPKDGLLYVNCYDNNIYKITDLEAGSFQLMYSKLYNNDQASLALGPKGKYLYYLDNGTLKVYDFAKGTLANTFYNINCGPELGSGAYSVAVSKKYIIAFNAEKQVIYLHDKKGNFKEAIKFEDGDYGFSLSYANGYIFVAKDGDYGMGKWYGYSSK